MAARRAATAARRSEEMAALEDLAATVATAATRRDQWRLVATAAMPVLAERAAMAASRLADLAALAVTAVTAATLMAATRLVATAAMEFWSVLVTTSLTPASSKGSSRG